jgi:hypothetical protein
MSAIGWLQSHLRMNGLEEKMGYIIDTVKSVGASLVGLQGNLIAVINATQATHKELIVVADSLLQLQRQISQNFSNLQSKVYDLQLQEQDAEEYNVMINHWRNFHIKFQFAKQKHDSYMNAAVKAMNGGPPDISIIDSADLWNKLEIIKDYLSSHVNFKCSFGDNIVEAFASSSVQHVSSDREGNFAIVLTIQAFNSEKFELFALYSYPFPIISENKTVIAYKKVKLSETHIAIVNTVDQPKMYTLPGRPEKIAFRRWTDKRPDARLVYSTAPTCESAAAFFDEDHIALCLLQAEAVHNVRPKYYVSDKHWMFTGTTKKMTEVCGTERTVINITPLMIMQPKCGCTYIEKDDRTFYNDKDSCSLDKIILRAANYSSRIIPTDEMSAAILLMLKPSVTDDSSQPHQSSWIPDIENIIKGQTTFDGTMAQMIHQQRRQAQIDTRVLSDFANKSAFDGKESWLAIACLVLFLVVLIFGFAFWCLFKKTNEQSAIIDTLRSRMK